MKEGVPPQAESLRDADLSELRHNLRTPLNQVLGYSEMLIEDASEAGNVAALEALRNIHQDGAGALADINALLANRESVARADLDSLYGKVRPRIDRIVDCAAALDASGVPDDWKQDLGRIAAAARSIPRILTDSPEPAQPEETAATPAPVRATGPRLLVVDDDASNRHLLRRRLERQGYRVEEARNGSEALDRVAEEEFDVVLLDIVMPVMDGFEVLARMKSDRRMRSVPVVVISALDELEGVARAIESGAEDYLLKPFDPVLLRARIGALLEKHRLRGELTVQERLASMGALAAGIAHEIKNPLNFVVNFAELSSERIAELRSALDRLDGKADPAVLADMKELAGDVQESVTKIREHGARADRIVASMLAHSRGQPGDRRPTDLNSLVREYVSLAFHGVRARDNAFHVALRADYDPAVGEPRVAPNDLSRVILNVASNAFYALSAKAREDPAFAPELSVVTRGFDDRVEVRIRDNGPGIPKHLRDRVFDPFFTTKPPGEGTGLGLSISHDIVVRGHRGELRLDSREGEYTEFLISIPRVAEPQ